MCIFQTQFLSSYEKFTALHSFNFAVFCYIPDNILIHEKKMFGTFESQCVSKNTYNCKKATIVRLPAQRNLSNTNKTINW